MPVKIASLQFFNHNFKHSGTPILAGVCVADKGGSKTPLYKASLSTTLEATEWTECTSFLPLHLFL